MKERVFFIPNRLFWVVLIIAGVWLLSVAMVMAQDPVTPGLDRVPITPTWLVSVFTFFGGAVLVSGLTGLLKMIPGNEIDANTLKEWVAGAVSILYLGFVMSGHADLFGQGADLINRLLPFVVGILGAFQGSSVAHNAAASVGLPLFGYQRTPQRE